MGRLADGPAFVSTEVQRKVERMNKTRDRFGNVVCFVCIIVPFRQVFLAGTKIAGLTAKRSVVLEVSHPCRPIGRLGEAHLRPRAGGVEQAMPFEGPELLKPCLPSVFIPHAALRIKQSSERRDQESLNLD